MKNLKRVLSLIVVVSVLTIFSCTKEGEQGVAGSNGTNGQDGNANVVSSTATNINWSWQGSNYSSGFTYGAITQDIIDNGAVFAYAKIGNGYNQIPLTFYNSGYSTSLEVHAEVGTISIFWTNSDFQQHGSPSVTQIKVVVMSASQRLANPNIDYTNYYEVKGAFNLDE